MEDADLVRRIKDVAYLEGDFVLRSGRRSTYYLDKYLFETQPDILAELGRRLARRAQDADLIAGAELGGVPLAAATALAAAKRSTKRSKGIVPPAANVVVVEDVVTTGGQVVEAAKVLADAGLTVTRIVCTIDRLEGGRENIESAGFAFEALLTKDDLGL